MVIGNPGIVESPHVNVCLDLNDQKFQTVNDYNADGVVIERLEPFDYLIEF